MGQIIQLLIIVLTIAGMWKVFEKAGKPGWAAIIPFYNLYVLVQIVGKPAWWFVLCLLIIPMIFVAMDLAECFGKSKGWGYRITLLLRVYRIPHSRFRRRNIYQTGRCVTSSMISLYTSWCAGI